MSTKLLVQWSVRTMGDFLVVKSLLLREFKQTERIVASLRAHFLGGVPNNWVVVDLIILNSKFSSRNL